jgi:hypothetical protein
VPQRRVPVTALMAWPNFHREMETEVENQVAAPAAMRTPNWHRANKTLTEECGWKGGDRVGWGATQELRKTRSPERLLPFLPGGMVTDRSSPSRVRYAAKNAPLTAPGRSAHPPTRKEREILGMVKQNLLDLDRPSHGRPLHSKPPNHGGGIVRVLFHKVLLK